jgi:hypothetical protein
MTGPRRPQSDGVLSAGQAAHRLIGASVVPSPPGAETSEVLVGGCLDAEDGGEEAHDQCQRERDKKPDPENRKGHLACQFRHGHMTLMCRAMFRVPGTTFAGIFI